MRFYAQSEGFVFFRPREGYELHPLQRRPAPALIWKGFRPREGYELHHALDHADAGRISFRPREGYELHRQK